MWSDRTPPERLHALVAKLHSVLRPPSLRRRASTDQIDESLHPVPGFAYVTGTKPLLLNNPLATVTYSNGSAVITSDAGTVELSAPAFDVLEAMLEAWRGHSEAILAGFLSYDLATEIEDLGPIPRPDFTFPQFYFGPIRFRLNPGESSMASLGNYRLANSTGAPQPPRSRSL